MAKGNYLVIQDKTTCGGIITEGDTTHTILGKAVAREQDRVTCGKHPGTYIIVGHIPGDSVMGRKFAGTLHSFSSCPCKARFIPSMLMDTYEFGAFAATENKPDSTKSEQQKKKPEPLIPPVRIYETKRKMDDYTAKDMYHGDLSENVLKNQFNLWDVSAKVNPYTGLKINTKRYVNYFPDTIGFEQNFPDEKEEYLDKEAVAKILFDEFRDLSSTFSFYGEYKGVIRKMITHMQENSGRPFSDPLLDKALKEQILNDSSERSSLKAIKKAIKDNIDWGNEIYPLQLKDKIKDRVGVSVLPKFNDIFDNVNGLVIMVHDTWSTHITLQSLTVTGNTFTATIHYRIQDHFGLDDEDISNMLYRQARIFRIWFFLQRSEKYNYKPFITEMNATITISGNN